MNRRIFKEQTTSRGDVPFYKIGTFGKEPDAYISRELFEEYKAKYPYPEKGDLMISASGSIGRIVEFKGEDEYFQDSNIVWLQHDGALDNTFLKQFYEVVQWSGVEGTTIKRLYNKDILDTEIRFPQKEEQTHIGTFFRALDNTIANNKRKLDGLRELKKAYLQVMFPQAGETVPRVRFAGFAEPWEMRKLGDIVKVNSGRDYKHLNLGEIPVFGTGGYMLSVDESLSEEDAIGIGRKGTIDKPQLLKAPFWTVDTLFFITPKPSNELRFLFSLTQSIEWAKHDESTGVPSLSKINIENIVKYVPSYDEQKCIGSFFFALDNQIDAQTQKTEQLNRLKSAYLQKMFV